MKTIRATRKTRLATAMAAALLAPSAAPAQTSSTDGGVRPAGSVEAAVSKEVPFDRDPPPDAAVALLENGYRRVVETVQVSVTAEELAEMEAAGKSFELDPQTGELITERVRDFLPVNWGAGSASGERVDSYGNPIVNTTDGLPAWAQRDVDALRQAIVDTMLHRQNLLWALDGKQDRIVRTPPRSGLSPYSRTEQDMSGNLLETEGLLGNYIGQVIVRDIAFDDLVDLFDARVVTDRVADSVLDYLHFYENLKFVRAEQSDDGDRFSASTYDRTLEAFAAAHGRSMDAILALDADGSTRATPSGCYNSSTFTRGMTALSGSTVIWSTNAFDNVWQDVPIGFIHYQYSCDDPDGNTSVRVSTNGYISFFQQGGGATDGLDFSNNSISSTIDPDGYAAPFWDDLWIAPAQGAPDKVSYKTEGSVPDRVFTVEWSSVSHVGGNTIEWHWFQVKLFEVDNDVELHLETGQDWRPDTADSATIGMEDFAGADGDCGPNCNASNTDPPNNYRFRTIGVSNSTCGGARCLDTCTPATGTTFGARGELDDTIFCGGADYFDVWYRFTPSSSATYTFSTAGSLFDTTLAIFEGCGGSGGLNQLGCDDDGGPGLTSEVSALLSSGSTYRIRVSGSARQRGDFTLTASGGVSNTCGGSPDLLITESSLSPTGGVNPGQTITQAETVRNSGSASVGRIFGSAWYISTDANVTTSDRLWAWRTVPRCLHAGTNSSNSNTRAWPTNSPYNTPGTTYYVKVMADDLNNVSESNENNNWGALKTVTLKSGCQPYDMNNDGIVSIIGDVPCFVDCIYFGNCDCCEDWCTCAADCNCDGFTSIIGDVPCFVDCVYFGTCAGCGRSSESGDAKPAVAPRRLGNGRD